MSGRVIKHVIFHDLLYSALRWTLKYICRFAATPQSVSFAMLNAELPLQGEAPALAGDEG